jgi:5-methylthioadenosine/S-adenosylhomocysteine deaminase
MPVHDPLALLTYSAQASDVKMTMINGKILYENNEFKTIDFDRVKYDLAKSMDRLFK